jgi:hypothetical protein
MEAAPAGIWKARGIATLRGEGQPSGTRRERSVDSAPAAKEVFKNNPPGDARYLEKEKNHACH